MASKVAPADRNVKRTTSAPGRSRSKAFPSCIQRVVQPEPQDVLSADPLPTMPATDLRRLHARRERSIPPSRTLVHCADPLCAQPTPHFVPSDLERLV